MIPINPLNEECIIFLATSAHGIIFKALEIGKNIHCYRCVSYKYLQNYKNKYKAETAGDHGKHFISSKAFDTNI